jgi:uncharacterized membrane protein YgdD (TMEM256/DUF423 family)
MNKLLTAAGCAGLTAVALGAFGAHALHDRLAAGNHLGTWETAVQFQLVHAVAALAALAAAPAWPEAGRRRLQQAAACWLGGSVAFSGSLYLLALNDSWRWLGPVTPLGGLALLAGWALVVAGGWKGGAK